MHYIPVKNIIVGQHIIFWYTIFTLNFGPKVLFKQNKIDQTAPDGFNNLIQLIELQNGLIRLLGEFFKCFSPSVLK